jgi:hypothetical protein
MKKAKKRIQKLLQKHRAAGIEQNQYAIETLLLNLRGPPELAQNI